MENRVFFPQAALDHWIVDGTVDLQQSELTILAEGRSYRLTDAVRVTREVSGGGDPYELVGRVKPRVYLEELGAEIVETSMLLGEEAYDIEPGWLAAPVGSFAHHLASEARMKARPGPAIDAPRTEEDLLGKSLVKAP
jgi:hypothetical protein